MRFTEWQVYAQSIDARAESLSRSIVERARKAAGEAGLDPSMPFLHARNAIVSRDYGKPWPEVNYSKARLVLKLEKDSWVPSRLADIAIARAFQTVTR